MIFTVDGIEKDVCVLALGYPAEAPEKTEAQEGEIKYYLEDGTKSCEKCLIPHRRENYGKIVARYADIAELAKKK